MVLCTLSIEKAVKSYLTIDKVQFKGCKHMYNKFWVEISNCFLSFNSLKYVIPITHNYREKIYYVVCEHFLVFSEAFSYQVDRIENLGHSKNVVSMNPFCCYMLALCSYRLIVLLITQNSTCKNFQSNIVLVLGHNFCDILVIFGA